MRDLAQRFWKDERGLELSEYAVMAGLIIIVLVVAIAALSTAIGGAFGRVTDTINKAGVTP